MTPTVSPEPQRRDLSAANLTSLNGTAMQALPKAPPAVLNSTPNPWGLLMALRRRWLLALLLAVVGGGVVGGATWFFQKTTYTGRTLLLVLARRPVVLSELQASQTDFFNYQRNHIALVKSRGVLNNALSNPKVRPLALVQEKVEPVAWLERDLIVDFSVAPDILRIALTGDDPAALMALVDAVREAYVQDIIYRERNQRLKQYEQLKSLYAIYEERLSNKRKAYEALAKNFGTTKPKGIDVLHEISLKQIENTKLELMKVKTLLDQERFAFEARKNQNVAVIAIPNDVLEDHLKKDPEIARLSKTVAELEVEILHIERATHYPKNDPRYKPAVEALEKTKKQFANQRDKVRPEVADKIQKNYKAELDKHVDAQKQQIKDLENLVKLWEKEVQDQDKALKLFQNDRISLEYLLEEIEQMDETAKKIQTQISAIEIELQAPERVSLLEEAIAIRNTDQRIRLSVLGGGGVFALIVFGVALLEFRQRRVNTVDEVVRGLDMRLMGTLPAIPTRTRRHLGGGDAGDAWQNMLTESVDAARTMLLHLAREEGLQAVMVTSAVGGEGKTLLSCHLAVSLARAGYRILLVDCDLRRPAVHRVFNLALEPGFGDVLCGEAQIDEAVQPGPLDNLWILAAGKSSPTAFQALAQHRSKDLFAQLKQQFDFILVDSAPILPVADSLLLAPCVDAVMFSILRDVSRLPTVYAAYERLAALRVHFLGAVVNGAPGDYYRASYGYHAAGTTQRSVDEGAAEEESAGEETGSDEDANDDAEDQEAVNPQASDGATNK